LKLKNWGEDFPNNLPSLKDYPELLKIPGLIISQHDDSSSSESESESDATIIVSQDESDSDSTVIIPQDD
jgi:hypothetical protein